MYLLPTETFTFLAWFFFVLLQMQNFRKSVL